MRKPRSRESSNVPLDLGLCLYERIDPRTRGELIETLRRNDSYVCFLYDFDMGVPHALVMREEEVAILVAVMDYARVANADLVFVFIFKRN